MYWWPFYYNGTILEKLAGRGEEEKFLNSFEFLTQYPPEVSIGEDIGKAVEALKEFPKDNKRVERIFDKLIERNPKYYDDKQEWLKGE